MQKFSRRHLLGWLAGGIGTVAISGVVGVELVSHGVLPGKYALDQLDGACSVEEPTLTFAPLGAYVTGRFFSKARNKSVGYAIGYPPHVIRGGELPLIVMLHGFGGSHLDALVGMSPVQAMALKDKNQGLQSVALTTVDGGNGYWNPHPGDNPMAMVVDELIPICQALGLGKSAKGIALMGISMGGYGALEIAERNPGLASAVAAVSPAIWTSYRQASGANAEAFSSESAFDKGNVITHAGELRGIPVRVATGSDDPFLPGVKELAAVLPANNVVLISQGCHSASFFLQQEPPSLQFLARHLS